MENPGMQDRSAAGFTLIDVMVTIAVFAIVVGMAVPALTDVADSLRLGQATREVERELQTARLKAVTSNRPIRVRFNCPVAGEYRMVELIGTPASPAGADTANNRCQETAYPTVGDANPLTRPNHDGPTRRLPKTVTFGAAPTLEFWPDGSVHQQSGATLPWPVVPANVGTAVTLVKNATIARITINGLGKIQIAR